MHRWTCPPQQDTGASARRSQRAQQSPEEGGLQRGSNIGKALICALFEPSGIWKIQHWNIERSNEAPAGCVYTHPFSRCEKGQGMLFHIIGIRGYYIHIGVGSDVVCSFSIGNFQGLRWWSGQRRFHAIFMSCIEPQTT